MRTAKKIALFGLTELEIYINSILDSLTDFTTWTKERTSITANDTADPNGGNTGAKFSANLSTTNSFHIREDKAVVNTNQYTYKVFAKKGELDYIIFFIGTINKGKYFDLNSGVVLGDFLGTPDDATIEDAGDGWYLCTMTFTATSTANYSFRLYLSETGTSQTYTSVNGEGIYIWGSI